MSVGIFIQTISCTINKQIKKGLIFLSCLHSTYVLQIKYAKNMLNPSNPQ